MSATDDRTDARRAILEFLQESNRAKTIQDIHTYLLENTVWGESQRSKKNGDRGKQNMEKWLRNMINGDYHGVIKPTPNPNNGRQTLYSAEANTEAQKKVKIKDEAKIMTIEEACFLGLSEKFLDMVLPTSIHESMHDHLRAAKYKLRHFGENQHLKVNRAANNYINRIDIVPRGQVLLANKVPYEVIEELSKAIREEKCIKFKYKGRSQFQTYHPYGIVIREPKIYFLGVNDKDMRSEGPENCKILHYLCNRIESPAVTHIPNSVPTGFKTRSFIKNGGMAVEVGELKELAHRGFTLKLQFYNGNDNLRLDLEEFPLSAKQTIEDEPGTSNFVLTAPGMRASYHLVDWILGRMDRVEVLAPVRLRNYVAARIQEMHQRYA